MAVREPALDDSPTDAWETTSLGAILEGGQLGGNYKNGPLESDWPLIKMGNLGRGRITLSELEFIDRQSPPSARDRLRHGDVLFNTRNTLDLVGKVAVWREEIPEAYFNSNLMRLTFRPDRVEDPMLMGHVLNTPLSVSRLRALATGTTSVAAIYTRDLLGMEVLLPPRGLQRPIREALEDADALIESLEQLLAKKRQLKQGAMQELLTGKKRLPGFTDPWSRLLARDLGFFRGGTGFPVAAQGETSGDLPYFKVSDMNLEGNAVFMQTANNYVSETTRRELGATAFPKGSIVFAKVGAAVFLERKRILEQPSCLDNNMAAYVLDGGRVESRFIHYQLLNLKLSSLVSTTALPSLNSKVLGEIEFSLPNVAEQRAITSVLSTLDAELEALEARLAKARALKQGMAQALLTSRIRLAPFGGQASAAPPG
ncbi:MAG: restriction endonuclease subunit S [Rubrivivax sp.]|nr:restriction endonuclease subunit S [Rubrivivax sp.]